MGTNYYHHSNECACCGRSDVRHIGKSSGGWQFSFRGYPEADAAGPAVRSWADWQGVLTSDGRIVDEYGRVVPQEEFCALVERKRTEAQNCYDYCQVHHNVDNQWKDADGHPFSNFEFS